MEQRIYQGSVTPEGLADFLVQQYEPKKDLQAQKLGQGESFIVQIGRGDEPEELRHAVSVAISRPPEGRAAWRWRWGSSSGSRPRWPRTRRSSG
jgi:hypothetical protein